MGESTDLAFRLLCCCAGHSLLFTTSSVCLEKALVGSCMSMTHILSFMISAHDLKTVESPECFPNNDDKGIS